MSDTLTSSEAQGIDSLPSFVVVDKPEPVDSGLSIDKVEPEADDVSGGSDGADFKQESSPEIIPDQEELPDPADSQFEQQVRVEANEDDDAEQPQTDGSPSDECDEQVPQDLMDAVLEASSNSVNEVNNFDADSGEVDIENYVPVEKPAVTDVESGQDEQIVEAFDSEQQNVAAPHSPPESAEGVLDKPQSAALDNEPEAEEPPVASVAAAKEAAEPDQPNDDYMDILGNGQLLKKTLQKGRGEDTRPKTGFRVTLNYEARLTSSEGDIVDKVDGLTVTIGDYDFLQAFDIALMVTEAGERCEIRCGPRHAYGSKLPFTTPLGCQIPPDSTLSFLVDLVSVEEPLNVSAVTIEDLLVVSDVKRERGNFWFNREDYYTAVCCYSRAAALLEQRCSADLSNASNAAVQSALDARVRVYNNLAACQLKLEAWDSAIESCEKALRLQASNAKTLYRLGRALIGKGQQEAALKVMRSALAEEPDSRTLQNEVARLTLECRRQQTASQDLYRRMMGVSRSPEATSPSPSPSSRSAGSQRSAAASSASSASLFGRYKFWLVGAVGTLAVSVLLAGAAYRNNR